MSDKLDLSGDVKQTNEVREAEMCDWVVERRQSLRISGPFIVGSGFHPHDKQVMGTHSVHMDHITATVPHTAIQTKGSSALHVIYGTHVFHGSANTVLAYSVDEIIEAIENWSP